MTLTSRDPATMLLADRLAELGEILAAGALRYLAHQGKARSEQRISREHLDESANGEAQCAQPKEDHA